MSEPVHISEVIASLAQQRGYFDPALRWVTGGELDPCADPKCKHLKGLHGSYGCSVCPCKRWVF
jgi:hypothetical protein